MKKIRLICVLLTVAACLVLLATGFAAWYPINRDPQVIDPGNDPNWGRINVYSAAGVVDCIKLRDSATVFKYNVFSFCDAEGNATDEGEIELVYSVDVGKLAAAMQEAKGADWTEATLHLGLTYANIIGTDPGLFADVRTDGTPNRIVTVTVDGDTATHSVNASGNELTFEYAFSRAALDAAQTDANGNKIFNFTVRVNFNVPSNGGKSANFRNCFGKYIKSGEDGTSFTAAVYFVELA